MNFDQVIKKLNHDYSIVGTIEISEWSEDSYVARQQALKDQLIAMRKDAYRNDERILVIRRYSDLYVGDDTVGLALKNLQIMLDEVDISNFFVIVISNSARLADELASLSHITHDESRLTGIEVDDHNFEKIILSQYPTSKNNEYKYGSFDPIKISLNQLSEKHRFLLTQSQTFCMYPWIHMHAWPTGEAFPCCHAESHHWNQHNELGNTHNETLKEIWNSKNMRQLRVDMLQNKKSDYCVRCYEQEKSGFFSGRQSANKHHGHHIARVDETMTDGTLNRFEMTYWDIRFSNLCNLKCRTCGHIFSSSWFKDQVQLAGPAWEKENKALNIAGRFEMDIFKQLLEHIESVEQIYFAGGEPLMMEEHYAILDELERRKMFHVRLIYNTNFTQTKLKQREVFDYWRKFDSVSVGASLDAMGKRAEYMRAGTKWEIVEANRRRMMEVCPNVDFYVSATLSIMNALHLPDFHRDWVNKDFIKPQDFNINILQDPAFYRIDIATPDMKNEIEIRYKEHLDWLRDQDPLSRATVGYESALRYMWATDNTKLIPEFWNRTNRLDQIRNESIIDFIPEMEKLL